MNLSQTRFKLQESLILKVGYLGLSVGAFFCIFGVPIYWWAKILLTFCILIYLKKVAKKYILLCANSVQLEFWFDGSNWWQVQRKFFAPVLCYIRYPVFVSEYLVIINFIAQDKKEGFSLPIFKDSLNAEDFRKLKIILKSS